MSYENDYGVYPHIATMADIAKYDSDGRLIWNQVGLNGSALLTRITDLGFDDQENMVVAVKQITADQQRSWSLARLSEDGNIDWIRPMPNPEHGRIGRVGISVDPRGYISVLNTVEVLDGEGESESWTTGEVLFDRFGPNGGAQWTWRLPTVGFYREDFSAITQSDSNGVSLLGVAGTGILRFSPTGDEITVSNIIDQADCEREMIDDDMPFDNNYPYAGIHDIEVAAICSRLSFVMSISDQLYFTSQFGGKADAANWGEKDFDNTPIDDYLPNAYQTPLQGIVAFGRLHDVSE